MTRELLTVADAAQRLAVRESTLRFWLRRRKLAKVIVGSRSVRVPVEAVEEMISSGFVPARREVPSDPTAAAVAKPAAAVRAGASQG